MGYVGKVGSSRDNGRARTNDGLKPSSTSTVPMPPPVKIPLPPPPANQAKQK